MLRYKILDIFVKKNNNLNLDEMNKLIKPKQIDEIIRSGVVLKSRKEYLKLPQVNTVDDLKTRCGVRVKNEINNSNAVWYNMCIDVKNCHGCFLQANNYLNILKYIKNNKEKFPYVYKGIESIF